MEKVNEYMCFLKLMAHFKIDINRVTYRDVYVDANFYDYIARYDNTIVNFCKVSEANRCRYEVLYKLHNWLIDSPSEHLLLSEVGFETVDGTEWFYEFIPMFDDNFIRTGLTLDELHTLWKSIDNVNEHLKKFSSSVDSRLAQRYNAFMDSYSISKLNNNSILEIQLVDVWRLFELQRIKRVNNGFAFVGLQSMIRKDTRGNMPIHIFSAFFATMSNDKATALDTLNALPYSRNDIIGMLDQRIKFTESTKHNSYIPASAYLDHLNSLKDTLCE